MDIAELFASVLAVLVYSGPLIPLSATLLRRASPERFRFNLRLLAILMTIQVLFFMPFIFEVVFDWPDFLYALILPMFSGLMLLVAALVYSIRESIQLRSSSRSSRDA